MVDVDPNAPAFAAAELAVDAPTEVVWDVVSSIEAWPTWNPDVQSATLEGELAPGTRFRWQAGRAKIVSTLEQVSPPTVIGWSGKLPGLAARHVWRIHSRDGQTFVATEESWHGVVPRLFPKRSRAILQTAVDSGLQAIKIEAERRVAAS